MPAKVARLHEVLSALLPDRASIGSSGSVLLTQTESDLDNCGRASLVSWQPDLLVIEDLVRHPGDHQWSLSSRHRCAVKADGRLSLVGLDRISDRVDSRGEILSHSVREASLAHWLPLFLLRVSGSSVREVSDLASEFPERATWLPSGQVPEDPVKAAIAGVARGGRPDPRQGSFDF